MIGDMTSLNVEVQAAEIDQLVVLVTGDHMHHAVSIQQQMGETLLICDCGLEAKGLCSHQTAILLALIKDSNLMLFFDLKMRQNYLKKQAYDYGLENEDDLDEHFDIHYDHNDVSATPKNTSLIPITGKHLASLSNSVLKDSSPSFKEPDQANIVVLKPHKYYQALQVELCTVELAKNGKLKNPIEALKVEDKIWEYGDTNTLKFLMAVARLQKTQDQLNNLDIEALKVLVKNDLHHSFYYTQDKTKLSASSLKPVELKQLYDNFRLEVNQFKDTYDIKGVVDLNGQNHSISELTTRHQCFIEIHKIWYLLPSIAVINTIKILKEKGGQMVVSASGYEEFKSQFLNKIDSQIRIDYSFIKKASPKQLALSEYLEDKEQLIYLTDHGSHVMIIPVMRYSDVEISVRTNRQIYGRDEQGHEFLVDRNNDAESDLLALLVKQHPDFNEQLENPLDHFYLHKRKFLDENWFLPVFEEWEKHDIRVFGFNELEGHKFNPHKPKIDIKVHSGLNWFNAEVKMKFGKKKVGLKKVQVAVKNKSKYIQLDDGSLGIMPKEWLDRFEDFFTAGDISEEDLITIPKIHISDVEEMFEQEELDEQVIDEIRTFQNKVKNFTEISEVKQPEALNGTLRPYQLDGLKWLNFLDDFNFGGCLADDMGLGKSIQIIAFMLLQNEKVERNTNLLVVPTTLIFNWQAELKKFAPSLSVHTLHGSDRMREIKGLDNFEVIITTYGTLLTDINYLKNFEFNYVFLDESQRIKNPNSQRFKAVKMLQARNRVVITGTPIENNTFDLYSQFSFACPGLFSTKQHFKELYSVPIDQFKDQRRAKDLQNKIKPFLLRRTKDQVARELPLKTETVLYCPMDKEQRDTYLVYEKEFREFVSATEAEQLKDATMHVLRGLTKLRQICNSTKLLKSDEVVGQKTSSKIEVLKEQIELNAPHHKMVIFSQFVSMLELIQAELASMNVNHIILTGKSSNREAIVNEFRNNDDVRVALISLKAGGTGLNLVEADYVYLVDPWWNPAVENQAIDRLHRIGQEKNITAIRLICPDTLEEKIMELQQNKKELTSQMIGNNDGFFKSLTKKELLGLVSVY